jgi:SAM-dependent methyltransferase
LPDQIETVIESIYDHPKYYDLVFGADCAAELKYIVQCGQEFAKGKIRKLFEPACGTGRLLFHLAKRGYSVSGIDLNPKAIDFCNERLLRHKIRDRAWVADMSNFETKGQFDIAFNTINSFRHLGSEKAAQGHMDCMAKCVRSGGLYLLGVHLTPTKGEPSEGESWSARRGHLAINTHMWTIERNSAKRVERFGIRFDIHNPTRSWRVEDVLVLRSYTASQMKRLIEKNGQWEIVETHDFCYDIHSPVVVDAASEDVVYVMRRK